MTKTTRCLLGTAAGMIFCFLSANAQVLTAEDSLYAGLLSKEQSTVISGYGEAKYSIDTKRKTSEASLFSLFHWSNNTLQPVDI